MLLHRLDLTPLFILDFKMDISIYIKRFLVLSFFGLLLGLLILSKIPISQIKPLKGAYTIPSTPQFKLEEWFAGSFQQEKEKELNAIFGARPLFVRLNNQIDYTLFSKLNANGVTEGKDHFLFEIGYFESYNGKDFVGADSINKIANRIKFVSNELQKINKKLIIIFAPNKVDYYSEYVPIKYQPLKNKKTNYSELKRNLKDANLNSIDFNELFCKWKKNTKYPLFPKYGVHWSNYGAVLAEQLIINSMSRFIAKPMRTYSITNIEIKSDILFDDCDLEEGSNLLFKLPKFPLAYPNITAIKPANMFKPNVLVVSDSYYWQMYNMNIAESFNTHHFWFYNKQIYPESFKEELLVESVNIKEQIDQHDLIIVMSTITNLNRIGWGFLESLEIFFKGTYNYNAIKKIDINKLNNVIAYIKKDKVWIKDAQNRATEKKISLDSAIVLEAMWQLR